MFYPPETLFSLFILLFYNHLYNAVAFLAIEGKEREIKIGEIKSECATSRQRLLPYNWRETMMYV